MITTVGIIGAYGRMGQQAIKALSSCKEFQIVAQIGRHDNLVARLEDTKPDVVFEFSGHETVYQHTKYLMDNDIRFVIGSSGLSQEQIQTLTTQFRSGNKGGLIVPNFSMAVAQFCRSLQTILIAMGDYEAVKIIEYHHSGKKDAPSGTARHIASLIGLEDSNIESVRNDTYYARHDVIITLSNGEEITLSVNTPNISAYHEGIRKSAHFVKGLNSLIVGLENIPLCVK
jgi:4-hydroxy-tetrahydrodipicolinate reductase